eukprot:scaffold19877_cov129-Isochrysis_galbana.AAC.1
MHRQPCTVLTSWRRRCGALLVEVCPYSYHLPVRVLATLGDHYRWVSNGWRYIVRTHRALCSAILITGAWCVRVVDG